MLDLLSDIIYTDLWSFGPPNDPKPPLQPDHRPALDVTLIANLGLHHWFAAAWQRIRENSALVGVSSRLARASGKLSFYHCFAQPGAESENSAFLTVLDRAPAASLRGLAFPFPKTQLLSLFFERGPICNFHFAI